MGFILWRSWKSSENFIEIKLLIFEITCCESVGYVDIIVVLTERSGDDQSHWESFPRNQNVHVKLNDNLASNSESTEWTDWPPSLGLASSQKRFLNHIKCLNISVKKIFLNPKINPKIFKNAPNEAFLHLLRKEPLMRPHNTLYANVC